MSQGKGRGGGAGERPLAARGGRGVDAAQRNVRALRGVGGGNRCLPAGARLAAPGLLWWRAQIRRRNEALERVERPLVGAQIFTLLLALAAAGGLAAWEARRGLRWFWWSTDEPGGSMKAGWQAFGAEAWAQLQAMGKWDSELLVPIVLMVALLTGVACYLAFRSAGDRS